MYNYKIEMFNSLLYVELQNNQYVHFFDSNVSLTYDMFSVMSGRINNFGLQNMFRTIMDNIRIDFDIFPFIHSNTDIDNAIASTESCYSSTNHLFRV
jgi:hypothetical protein